MGFFCFGYRFRRWEMGIYREERESERWLVGFFFFGVGFGFVCLSVLGESRFGIVVTC